jgi:hypothetical protein
LNSKFLIIHPYDRSTFFLNKIERFLRGKFPKEIDLFNVKPSHESHEECIYRVSNLNKDALILFLGHGHSDKLFGASSDPYSYIPYHNDNFISEDNIEVFKNKKIICLSCNSKGKIANLAIEKGVITFVGFGDIPTTVGEFDNRGYKVGGKSLIEMKCKLNQIIKYSIYFSIERNYNFKQFVNLIKLITNKKLSELLHINNKNKRNILIYETLFYFKNEVSVFGKSDAYLLNR